MNKKAKIIIICTIIFIILFVIFNKISKNGNNITSQGKEQDILNLKSYNTIAEVRIKSNKNENKYLIKQKYQKNENEEILEQEVLEPSNISGLKIVKKDNNLIVENSELKLKTVYENYEYISDNCLDLISFIKEFKNNKESNYNKEKEETVLKVNNKTLYIDSKNNKPIKMEIKDANKKSVVYILYKEINLNS